MALRKTWKANLRSRYTLHIEIGLTATLAVLILLFTANFTTEDGFEVVLQEQERVQMEEILQTQQFKKPPPPPRPPVPVEVPNDEILEDEPVLEGLDPLEYEPSALPPPPPPAEEVEKEPEPEIFVIVEQMPELIGGLGELQQKIRYPEMAKQAGVEGRVIVQFVVQEDGSVADAIVVREVGAGCDEEALRAVREAKFTPGKQRGIPVKVKMSLPITFKLK